MNSQEEVRSYFTFYTQAGQRTSQELHMLLQGLEKQQSAAAPPDPYRYEQLVDGRRTYLAAHPRRSATPTGQYRLLERNGPFVDFANPTAFIEKAEAETRLKRHTPASGMPHFNVPNATPQHPECHTSACPKCGISPP